MQADILAGGPLVRAAVVVVNREVVVVVAGFVVVGRLVEVGFRVFVVDDDPSEPELLQPALTRTSHAGTIKWMNVR